MNIILIVAGLLLILGGANYLTDGSAALAKKLKISEFIIGLTIVAVGTSLPELVVSSMSAYNGSGAMAIGNVVGSNIFNTYVVLGICALFSPVVLTSRNMKIDIPMGILISVVLIIACWGGTIHRVFGLVMFHIYIAMILFSIRSSRKDHDSSQGDEEIKSMPMWLSLVMVFGGLGALIYGGNIFLDGAINVAKEFGISDKVIAITLLAGGTSLPELAASVISLIKGKSDIALGNIIGSNIANILLVLGVTSFIMPLSVGSITMFDLLVVLGGMLFVYLSGFIFVKNKISRVEGAVMLIIFVAYIYYIVS